MILFKSRQINSLSAFSIYVFILPIVCVSASSVPLEYGEFKLFQTPVTYDLNTSLSITDDNGGGRVSGYRIEAAVGVEPLWSDQETDFLLKFHLEVSRLWIGAREAPLPSAWSGRSSFYARLTHGAVQTAYLDKQDPLDLLNYKKSIVSLFQFRAIDGETKETDVSGVCDVLYESSSLTTIHKTKTGCGGPEPETWSRRATYSLSAALDALRGVHADEHVVLGRAGAQLSARASHHLRLRITEPRPAGSVTDLEHALRSIPSNLAPAALTLQADALDPEVFEELPTALESLRELLSTHEAGEDSAGAGGDIPTAMAALRVLPALAAADAEQILRVLRDEKNHALLPALCRMLGLTGTAAAHAAVNEHLQLASRDPPKALSLQYLAGAALASRPAPSTRAALLQLAESARAAHVADGAALAAAAQARRDAGAARTVRDFVTKALSRCKDDECRIVRLHALGNLRLADSAEALLSHAERGARGVALAALDALDALPTALDQTRLERLQAIATRGGRALEVRASALDLLLRRAPRAVLRGAVLRGVARQLRRAHPELRRVLRQRAQQLADHDPLVRDALKALDKEDLTWDARALGGTSHVLSRSTGWRLGDSVARLESAQFAAAGLLRRGVVTLLSRAPGQEEEEEELAVEVWTRGLEAVAGGSEEQLSALDEGEEAGGDVRGGLRLRVGGVHAPGVVLFDGQAELLGHIWAGAGSAATPALRAALARAAPPRALHSLAGAALAGRAGDVKLFAVDAQAQVSLWSRSARAELELRVATAAHTRISAPAPGGARIRADSTHAAAPRMSLAAHLDFYDGVALCVRAHLTDHHIARNVTGQVTAARRAWRERKESVWHAGRTLALGRDNDVTCRDLAHADA